MQAVTRETMRSIENATFSSGQTTESLMDSAGLGIAEHILRYYPQHKHVTAYLGKGHNAGDALVALEHLREAGWEIALRSEALLRDFTPLTRKKLLQLDVNLFKQQKAPRPNSLLLDGLVGIGAEGALRAPLKSLAAEMNLHRSQHGCTTIALDVPSGIDANSGEIYPDSVRADHTLCIGLAKIGLLHSSVVDYVGAIGLVKLDAIQPAFDEHIKELKGPSLITAQSLTRKRRPHDTHKGQAGRVGIWAGSEGMLGAAALCARAALKSGAGLVTLFTPPTLYPILAAIVPTEVMIKPTIDPRGLLEQNFDALVIGPGIGTPVPSVAEKLLSVMEQSTVATVLDADMLNLIARENAQQALSQHCIITPHPAEMLRLFPDSAQLTREKSARQFSEAFSATLYLKGARSIVASAGQPLHINSSGTPAMATAGQGDVLAGLIGGLAAQGYSALDCCRLAGWLCGEASQLALASGHEVEETLCASDTLRNLPQAFAQIIRRDSSV